MVYRYTDTHMTLTLRIDPASAVPLWHQIELAVRRLVGSGTLGAGAQMPSVRDLARELCINPATVVKAYQALTDAGLVEVRRGEGTFVREAPVPPGRAARRSQMREAAAQYAGAAHGLGVSLDEALLELRTAWPASRRATSREER
jgi:DNA-binding transcriptional regulator YhcF (GntR family)